jgi:hypothetical protein
LRLFPDLHLSPVQLAAGKVWTWLIRNRFLVFGLSEGLAVVRGLIEDNTARCSPISEGEVKKVDVFRIMGKRRIGNPLPVLPCE